MKRRILLTTAAVALSVGAVPVTAQMPGPDDPRARQRIQQPQPQQPTQGPATQPQALDRQPAQRGLQTQQPEQPAQRNLQTQQPEAQPPRGVRPAQPSATHGQRPQTPAQPGQARQPTGQPPAAQTPQRPGTEPAQRPAQAQQPPAQAQRQPNVPSSGVVTLNNQQRIQIAQSIQRQNVQPLRSLLAGCGRDGSPVGAAVSAVGGSGDSGSAVPRLQLLRGRGTDRHRRARLAGDRGDRALRRAPGDTNHRARRRQRRSQPSRAQACRRVSAQRSVATRCGRRCPSG